MKQNPTSSSRRTFLNSAPVAAAALSAATAVLAKAEKSIPSRRNGPFASRVVVRTTAFNSA